MENARWRWWDEGENMVLASSAARMMVDSSN